MSQSRVPRDHLIRDQVSAMVVDSINDHRVQSKLASQQAQDDAFQAAQEQINIVRDFVGNPDKILGSELTKHGEIAEQVEVGIRNARSALHQEEMTATHAPNRTAPEDYLIDGTAVQSKFINGASKNLDHVMEHMDKYANFGRDGSYYHIPKDHHETIMKVMNGESVEGLSPKSINAIREKVQEIESRSGIPFNEVVKPGVSDYAEVQQGKVHETLDNHEKQLDAENKEIKDQIAQDHQASLAEAAKAAAIAGAVGGAVSFSAGLYSKYKQGKNPFKGDLTAEDWKDLGVSTLKGTAGGAVAGGSIYLLTNYAALPAPFAGAVVSAAKGVGSLWQDYHAGTIDAEEFMNLGLVVCAESAIVGLATAAGQTLIPIPVLGAVIGSLAGKMLVEFTADKDGQLVEQMKAEMDAFLAKLNEAQQKVVAAINAEYDRLGKLTEAAFDFGRNEALLLQASADLAKAYGVEERLVIATHSQLDDFMLS
ncbi:hypothetical protein [Desulfosediminicola ganghwensis]|uniref:hypothetical protein n=1 Tax=Desulfosediminicola ganghwensis TaxID=2569540 RepID=UPI0010ABCBDD|nr:hypothetical protein [Desulfosediminicola ganghwensis]